jgi:hypothetical protein
MKNQLFHPIPMKNEYLMNMIAMNIQLQVNLKTMMANFITNVELEVHRLQHQIMSMIVMNILIQITLETMMMDYITNVELEIHHSQHQLLILYQKNLSIIMYSTI